MGVITTVVALAAVLSLSSAWPRKARSNELPSNFVGEATNELSTAILQSYVDDESNLAFSPLGYSVILAILTEGAHGVTKTQLSSALKLPDDIKVVREMYQGIMRRLNNTNEYKVNTPEFKNWFYVYKNYTVNEDYRKILETFYLTEVKSVEKYDSSFFQIKKESVKSEVEDSVEQIDPLPSIEIKDPVVKNIAVTKDNSKDVQNFEKLQEEAAQNEKVPDKKVGESVDTDKKDVVKPQKEEKSPKIDDEKIISFAMEDKPEKAFTSEIYDKQDIKPGKNIKEKIKLANTFSKKTHELGNDYEIMEAVEARNHARTTKALFGKDDVTNSLSTNRVGSKNSKDPNSLMILFNGLYFRGSWKTPFENIPEETFYKSATEKKTVDMMTTKGKFKTGSLPGLDSVAVEIPYAGDRYALLLVVPRARDGLRRLAADLPGLPPSKLPALLQEKSLTIRMPAFYIEVTTKPLAALAKFGVSSIFGPEADLSGISPVDGLFVQEMVQHVSVKVDNGGSSHAQITASNPSLLERSVPINEDAETPVDSEEFVLDRPFLFFVRDVIDNIVVVAGKVTDPGTMAPFGSL